MRAPVRGPNRWLIATMCTVLQLCLGTVYAWSYFQPLLVEQFRWTNTATSWAFSLNICCLGLSAAWGGINLARMGPRKLAMARTGMRQATPHIQWFSLIVADAVDVFPEREVGLFLKLRIWIGRSGIL